MTASTPTSISNPFTQSWIQALTLAADHPLAKTIKPKFDWIDQLSLNRPAPDRMVAAQELWDFAESEGLKDLLWLLPCNAPSWVFDRDDVFQYARTAPATADASFEQWTQAVGLMPAEFSLVAEVAGSDWSTLVRKEAVRLQHSLDTTAVQLTANLTLPCTAKWDGQSWVVQFDQVDWVKLAYEDCPTVPRPEYSEIEERLMWLLTTASDGLVTKRGGACAVLGAAQAWHTSVPSLATLHQSFIKQAAGFSPWLSRVWNCVWPIVYREQNVLNGRADLSLVRKETKECLTAQPRLTIWMFVFARLVCQVRFGRGLGVLADFHD